MIFNRFSGQENDWKSWWQNKQAKHFYFLGQDNLVFHTVMWPAQLLGANQNYNLPDNVVTSKFMNLEGKKFSKSRNWTISPVELADEFGVDAVRYYVASVLPENKEADFTWEAFVGGINNELIANIGNLVNRTLVFYNKHWAGVECGGEITDGYLKEKIDETFLVSAGYLENAEIRVALGTIMELGFIGNKYFNDSEVWQVVKTDKDKAFIIMQNLLSILAALSVLLMPYMPQTAMKLRQYLGLKEIDWKVGEKYWQREEESINVVDKIEPLFVKIDREKVLAEKRNE
jgi:methionyl-tRNA synthetase